MTKNAIEKSRRFVKISVPFWWFLSENWPIAIYRKTGPTKSTVLGPGPPPGKFIEIYRFLPFFTVLGAFNRAGKTVTKIGIYSKPPPKRENYGFFINSRLNFIPYTILFDHYPLQNWLLILNCVLLFCLNEY
jgi:hypothetical protein